MVSEFIFRDSGAENCYAGEAGDFEAGGAGGDCRRAVPVYAAETGGAVSGFRVSAITSGRKGSSRGAAVFGPCFG